jgi:hypothetical protein
MKIPSVTITSSRPDMNGVDCNLKKGEGTVMDDEPDWVYVSGRFVSGEGWVEFYGKWRKSETDIDYRIRLAETERAEKERRLKAASNNDRLLLSGNGTYYRVPTVSEFMMTWDELREADLVGAPDITLKGTSVYKPLDPLNRVLVKRDPLTQTYTIEYRDSAGKLVGSYDLTDKFVSENPVILNSLTGKQAI